MAAGVVRVIGVGNPDRGDDAIGPTVATELAARVQPEVEVVVCTADPSQLIDRWASADTVVLIDAVVDEAPPGDVRVFDAGTDPLPTDVATLSSHGMGIPGAVELARSLERLPERLFVVGVSAREFEGVGLSPEVEGAIERAVQAVMEVVGHA